MTRHSSPGRRHFIEAGLALALASAIPGAHAQGGASSARVLRIGYQKGPFSILKGRGTLDKRLAALGTRVEWTEFPSGPPQLEALNVGSIDFGDVGEAPPIFAQAAGAPFVYYGQTAKRPVSEAVVVPDDSPVTSFSELKGKRIALVKGSNTHFLLVRLLAAAKIDYRDVTPVWLSPSDARAAFERKAVDAWAIWDPFLAVAQKTANARIIADGSGVVANRAFYFTSHNYVQKNDDVLRVVLGEIGALDKWVEANRSEAAGEFAQLWGVPREIVEVALARLQYGVEPISRETLADQQRIADAFYELKLLPKRIEVAHAAPPSLA
ncbi:ABC transporter, substrate-binding, aliphatic sulfonates family protein [Paraburkholderia xenovorans LB400]|uniref:Putative aliphatic sulfonates-binding protein n=1 Tax=Paraburkholderia xenovorans (strain LB400) TaxID=266265 RepID=Q13IQ8_PARXL|nr:sulfonate ABC transporter substrate-binding protein [Paraburkholderia xenovorans]ABE36031.1 ABC aliphatic sulfonates transporter, periplasmic ligand binding protein [Paraburkholderia xenovorans LB400]AIP34235.1 ABC transporter, substrate-binding, aliphatic sulfonates family protein [Paraburkholderia xenovorans LB400]